MTAVVTNPSESCCTTSAATAAPEGCDFPRGAGAAVVLQQWRKEAAVNQPRGSKQKGSIRKASGKIKICLVAMP